MFSKTPKVIRRSATIYNAMGFLLLSLFYFHLTISIGQTQSALYFQGLWQTLQQYWWISLSAVPTFFALFFAKKIAIYLFSLVAAMIFIHLFSSFYLSFDKLILFLSVFYLVMAYYLYQLLRIEFGEAYFWPGYHYREIGRREQFRLKATLRGEHSSLQGKEITVYLTNWDQNSLFITLDDEIALKGRVKLELEGWGHLFVCQGVIATKYPRGYGIRLIHRQKKSTATPGWKEYYTIINDRGYRPLLLGANQRDEL